MVEESTYTSPCAEQDKGSSCNEFERTIRNSLRRKMSSMRACLTCINIKHVTSYTQKALWYASDHTEEAYWHFNRAQWLQINNGVIWDPHVDRTVEPRLHGPGYSEPTQSCIIHSRSPKGNFLRFLCQAGVENCGPSQSPSFIIPSSEYTMLINATGIRGWPEGSIAQGGACLPRTSPKSLTMQSTTIQASSFGQQVSIIKRQ